MSLDIRVSDRLTYLVEDLAANLGGAPLPPHQDECIVVQSLSLRRWLQQRLAESWGCAAGLELPFATALIADLEERLGLAAAADDPWQRDRLRWRIVAVADVANGAGVTEAAEDASGDLAPIARYLAAGHPAARPAKRLQLADRIADLFDAYQIYRPEMLAAWEVGLPWEGLERQPALRRDEQWQAALWRRLRAAITLPPRSQRLANLIDMLHRDGPPSGWHARISVLVTGVLPPRVVEVFEALAGHLPVTIWLSSPLPQPWGDVTSRREAARRGIEAQGHPLVGSLGRQAREWFRSVGDRPAWSAGWRWIGRDHQPADTVLGRIQTAIAERPTFPLPLAGDDHSLAFDCCHGPRREVEVARDRILAACAELPGLRPHEILVLAPDLTTYGPLCEAVFAGADAAIRLPVRIADRTIGSTDAVAEGLLAILALAHGRCTHGEVLDLLERPAVLSAAGLDLDQIGRAQDMLTAAGLRWGRDQAHRARLLGAPAEDHGTLAAVLDRLALGWAMGGDAVLGSRPACGPEGSPDHTLVGRLIGWLQRMLAALAELDGARALQQWSSDLQRLVRDLLEGDGLDAGPVHQILSALADDGADLPAGFTVHPAEIAAALHTAFGDEARASDFVSGCITVAGLKPMRMIPARVIVLLGMDDAGWPRRTHPLPFDLVAACPRPGDRLPREDDRQLVLEAILAARDRLIITWPGRAAQGDPRHERPPSACMVELFAAVDAACVAVAGQEPPHRALTTVHPLQPFAARHLDHGDDLPPLPSWDVTALGLARQLATPASLREPAAPFIVGLPPAASPTSWDLDELVRLWCDPAAAWCRARLGAVPHRPDDAIGDAEPLSSGPGLERFRLLADLVDGMADPHLLLRAAADGLLPLGQLGVASEARLRDLAARLHKAAGDGPPSRPLAVAVGTVTGVLDPAPRGGVLALLHPAQHAHGRIRVALAVRQLVWNAWQVERGEAPGGSRLVTLKEVHDTPAHGSDAPDRLAELLALSRSALHTPYPFPPRISWEMMGRLAKGGEMSDLAWWAQWHKTWTGSEDAPGERDQPVIALAWRGRDIFADVEAMIRVWGLLIP